jgi:hypothetical protein
MKRRIAGNWEGRYSYDRSGIPDGEFTMVLKRTLLGGIKGEVSDRGMDSSGTIEGRVWGHTIRFEKRTPVLTLFVDGKVIPASQYIEKKLGVTGVRDVPHPPVIYEGRFSEDFTEASGTWLLGTLPAVPVNADQYVTFNEGKTTGTWHMRRVD